MSFRQQQEEQMYARIDSYKIIYSLSGIIVVNVTLENICKGEQLETILGLSPFTVSIVIAALQAVSCNTHIQCPNIREEPWAYCMTHSLHLFIECFMS